MDNIKINLITKPNLTKRALAGLIDYGLMFSYIGLMMYLFGEPNGEGGYSTSGFPAFSIFIVWFILMIFTEQFVGATIGNTLLKLEAVPINDFKGSLTFGQSVKRHLLDMLDLWPFGLLGLILIKNTQYNQRLGDLWAKTIVIDKEDSE